MKKFAVICLVGAVLVGAAAWAWAVFAAPKLGLSTEGYIDLYQKNARTPIFTGFLTMGSFLLAMKTNILSRLKETYDTEEYRRDHLHLNAGKLESERSKFYAGLENLSTALGWNVVFCLVTSLLQMTLGFWSHPIPFAICTGFAGSCLALLVFLTFTLMSEHREWFRMIEKDAQLKLKGSDNEQGKITRP